MCLGELMSARSRNGLYPVTQYVWHTDEALEATRVNNIQQIGEACLNSPASPLQFDKIFFFFLLTSTSQLLRLQTAKYCPGNCCRLNVRQINLFLIKNLPAQFIYRMRRRRSRELEVKYNRCRDSLSTENYKCTKPFTTSNFLCMYLW